MEIGNQVGLGTLLLDVLGIAPSTNQDLFTKLGCKEIQIILRLFLVFAMYTVV